jgi:hypothetical protein
VVNRRSVRHFAWAFCCLLIGASAPSASAQAGSALVAAESPTLTARFEQSTGDHGSPPAVGRLFAHPQGGWCLQYSSPTEQTIVATDSLAVILYPLERRAFRIRTARMEPPRHLWFLLESRSTNRELAAQGLSLVDLADHGDTTVSTWRGSFEDPEDDRGEVVVSRVGGLIVRLELRSDGAIVRRFQVEESSGAGTARLPARVTIRDWSPGEYSEERVVYSGFAVWPDSGADPFQTAIPSGYSITERSW